MSAKTTDRTGVLYALLAYGSWGLSPLYWKLFGSTVLASEILSHRMVWSSILMLGVIALQRNGAELKKRLLSPRRSLPLLLTSSILAMNWGGYIYGVLTDRLVEASLGYYINPLVNVLLGALILKERLTWGQWSAVGLATLGVFNSVIHLGQVPWLALFLAFSFGFYGLLRKLIPVSPVMGLTLETVLLSPVAIIYLSYLTLRPATPAPHAPFLWLLFVGSGVVTSLPLLWFNQAAQRLPLSTLGFFQYLAPSLSLMLGTVLYREPFTRAHGITFGFIWAALLLYSLSPRRAIP